RGQLRGEDQVALVLPVLVVQDDDGAAVLDRGDRVLDGVQAQARRHRRLSSRRSTYFAITSTSRLTGSPGARRPIVVSRRVVGMRLTSNQGAASSTSLTALTVSETPSTAIDPFSTT